jgi:hypothetical protein
MHKLTPTIEEVIALTMWLTDKQFSGKLWTLETIVSPAQKFMQICTPVDHDIRNNVYFRSGD